MTTRRRLLAPLLRLTLLAGARARVSPRVARGIVAAGAPDVVRACPPRFERDAAQDLAALARTGQVAIAVDRVDGAYTVDASAVLRAEPRRLFEASVDYARYAEMGIPNLRDNRLVSVAAAGQRLHTWSWLQTFGYSSKHYLAVDITRDLARPRAFGICWTLTRRQPGWPHEDAPAFHRLDGSWYVEPLGAPHAGEVVYVRYFAAASPDSAVPEALVAWAIRRQLTEGTRGLIQALAREAARRP